MDMELREKNKRRGIKRMINSFKYSFAGFKYAYKYEQSMLIHFIATITAVSFGFILQISVMEWLIILILLGLVLGTELINTSLEAVVDLISPNIHPLAKIAKDTASAAVLVFSTISFISGLLIFTPKIIEILKVIN